MISIIRGMTFFPFFFATLCVAANPGGVPLNSLKLNGWAFLSNNDYVRLTRNSSQASSAFVPTPFSLGPNDSFTAFFVYQSGQELGQCVADGIAFVAQNTPAGSSYLGSDGSGLGFFTGTVSPAIAVTFDYAANQITGTPANAAAIATPNGVDLLWTTPAPPALSGPGAFRYVWVTYQNTSQTMRVFYSATSARPATPLLETTLPTDLSSLFGGQAYFGVTAGTGSCYSGQLLVYLALDVVNVP
ncbi:MAG TPA: hypothetical protein VN924_28555 [Bryobacteraceae bacterium]|nr:hypothetical protein [Bryobacteraceae bacterium]